MFGSSSLCADLRSPADRDLDFVKSTDFLDRADLSGKLKILFPGVTGA